jgi:hypothetical protein
VRREERDRRLSRERRPVDVDADVEVADVERRPAAVDESDAVAGRGGVDRRRGRRSTVREVDEQRADRRGDDDGERERERGGVDAAARRAGP